MRARASDATGPLCRRGEHGLCSHEMGSILSLRSRTHQPKVLLCTCDCHDRCPVGGRRKVPEAEWLDQCTCPGSHRMRDIHVRVREASERRREESERRRARSAEVLRDVDIGRGRSPAQIQQQLLAAYRAHGYEPPSDFGRWSRFLAAGTARRGTRTARLLVEAVRAIRAARRWSPDTPASGHPPQADPWNRREYEHNRSEQRRMGRATAACGLVAVTSAAGAYRTSGVSRIVLAVIAALGAALTAWMALWYLGLSTLNRIMRNIDQGSVAGPDR